MASIGPHFRVLIYNLTVALDKMFKPHLWSLFAHLMRYRAIVKMI